MSEMSNIDLEKKALDALSRAQEAQAKEKEEESVRVTVPSPNVDVHQSFTPAPTVVPATDGSITNLRKVEESDVVLPPMTEEEAKGHGLVTSLGDDKDDAVIFSGSAETTQPLTPEDEAVILVGMAKDNMPNVPDDMKNSFASKLLPEIQEYKKKLIIEMGLTPAEAQTAAQNRMKKEAIGKNQAYQQEHPEAVVLQIDKTQEKDVEKILDEDTKAKMVTSRAIKLMIVESKELETIAVKPVENTVMVDHLRDISQSLSHYSVPLISTGDYATFIGAQSGILANTTASENEDTLVTLQKKAELLYRQFRSATNQSRMVRNESGELVQMSFVDFCNWFRFDDIVMGLYAIVVASSTEETESSVDCPNCRRSFNIKYNNKALLDMSNFSDTLKKRVEAIDEARGSSELMKHIHEECMQHTRFKSPFTSNIYEFGNPSIAEVRKRFIALRDSRDVFDMIGSAADLFLYIDKIWIKDNDGQYFLVDGNENPILLAKTLPELHEIDIQMLWKWFNEHHDTPAFKIHTECPYCHRSATDTISPDELLFLQARAFWVEMNQ